MAAILLVDDEPDVRAVAAAILRSCGYCVIETAGADETLRVLLEKQQVTLLLTDLAMPGMDGMELANMAKELRPTLPVLYTSAYVRADSDGHAAFRHGSIIEKPWRAHQLEEAVRRAIGPPLGDVDAAA